MFIRIHDPEEEVTKMKTLSLQLRYVLAGLLVWAGALTAVPVRAVDDASVDAEAKTSVDNEIEAEDGSIRTETSVKQQEKAALLAEKFNVSQETVLDLRTQQNLGWGEISHLLAISHKSGESVDTILTLRKDGMGWGEIAQKYGYKLGEIKKEARAGLEKKRERTEEKAERLEERAEKMEQRGKRHLERRGEKIERRGERLERRAERLEARAERLKDTGTRSERAGIRIEKVR